MVSKIRVSESGSMPMPVSLTSIISRAAAAPSEESSRLRDRTGHVTSGRRELDRVLDQVPEDLLEPDRVGVDMVAARGKVDRELEPRQPQIVAADLDDMIDHLVSVDHFAVEVQGAAADSRQVEQVIDEPGFEDDVAADHFEYGPKRRRASRNRRALR